MSHDLGPLPIVPPRRALVMAAVGDLLRAICRAQESHGLTEAEIAEAVLDAFSGHLRIFVRDLVHRERLP